MKIICPICNTTLESVPRDYPHRPFCSQRCKLVDLHNWLSETYHVSEPLDAEAEDLN